MISELADLEHCLDVANKATLHGLPGETKSRTCSPCRGCGTSWMRSMRT